MNPFHYAKSFFSDDYLPQQLTWAFGLFLLSLVAVMAGVVLIRRAFGAPRRSSTGALPPAGLAAFERYEVMARFWHWGLFGMLLALWISGVAFYAPGSVPRQLPPFGMSWLFVHLAFAVLFIVGTVGHSVHGVASHLDPRTVWFDRHDWHELVAGARYYLGLPYELPKLGKFGVWNKVFHAALALLALIMIVSGISLSLDTLGWAEIDQNWQRRQRLLHDLGSYGFLVLFAAHVFWQLLKKRRPQLKSIFTGTIAADTFSSNHDWDRWKPDVVSQTADAGKVDHGQ
jgi:cytochrome b subunit of formate dehydrogenase